MKTRLLLALGVASLIFSTSCSEEEAPPHIVGEWTLREYAIINVPSEYSYSEADVWAKDDLGISSYTMTIKNDGKYERVISASNGSTDDSGTWELTDDTFILSSDNIGLSEDFEIEKNENSKLWLSQSATWPLVKDAIRDTITQTYIDQIYADGLTDEEFDILFDVVTVDFVSIFEK